MQKIHGKFGNNSMNGKNIAISREFPAREIEIAGKFPLPTLFGLIKNEKFAFVKWCKNYSKPKDFPKCLHQCSLRSITHYTEYEMQRKNKEFKIQKSYIDISQF